PREQQSVQARRVREQDGNAGQCQFRDRAGNAGGTIWPTAGRRDSARRPAVSALSIAIEVIGWTAAALFLLSYVLVSTGRLQGRSRAYQWLNIAGAIGFVINSGWNG